MDIHIKVPHIYLHQVLYRITFNVVPPIFLHALLTIPWQAKQRVLAHKGPGIYIITHQDGHEAII